LLLVAYIYKTKETNVNNDKRTHANNMHTYSTSVPQQSSK